MFDFCDIFTEKIALRRRCDVRKDSFQRFHLPEGTLVHRNKLSNFETKKKIEIFKDCKDHTQQRKNNKVEMV